MSEDSVLYQNASILLISGFRFARDRITTVVTIVSKKNYHLFRKEKKERKDEREEARLNPESRFPLKQQQVSFCGEKKSERERERPRG